MDTHKQMVDDIIKTVKLFHHFTPDQAEKILSGCQKVKLSVGDILIEEDSEGEEFYLLLAGSLKVITKKGDVCFANIRPITVVGEIAMLLHQPRSATVKAEKDCHLLRLSREDLQPFFKDDLAMELQLYRNLCEVLSEKLLQTNLIIKKYSEKE
ncbi:MAG: cyclic nucleotide-binding domain-containing protein [Candidatus Omnitrophica bacterium]|nr:cyclic nucleotide-binding domain-containing protein [Candidatus Omnitrophota bacterium]